jgi:ABC-type dipeptide/oligopeptide/nickel transport system permease component
LTGKVIKKSDPREIIKRAKTLVKNTVKNARIAMIYLIHGCVFSLLFFGFFLEWTVFVAFLPGEVAVIGQAVGLVALFFLMGFLNALITGRLWFKVTHRLWDLLFHGLLLFGILYAVNIVFIAWPYESSPGIPTAVIALTVAAFVNGFLAKVVAGQWKQERMTVTTLKGFLTSSLFKYIVRRLLYMIPLFIGISIVSFFVMYAAGDPLNIIRAGRPNVDQATIDALRAYYGLDQPIPLQYLRWLSNLLQGNFGKSLYGGRPVNLIIGSWFWETVKLMLSSTLIAFFVSIPIGINSAKKQYSKQDVVVTSFSLFGVSMPTFWLGIILIIAFSYRLGWLPSAGAYGQPNPWWSNAFWDQIAHLIMPVAVLVYVGLAQNVRLIRANMLEVLRSDYILAARASGLSERTIIYKYALRNAISPVITFLGVALGAIIAGAPMTEYTFGWPGLGRRFVDAATLLDFPVIMGITMIITIMTLIANLIVDIIYVYIDPRIRLR